jgi:hypothetical protein
VESDNACIATGPAEDTRTAASTLTDDADSDAPLVCRDADDASLKRGSVRLAMDALAVGDLSYNAGPALVVRAKQASAVGVVADTVNRM